MVDGSMETKDEETKNKEIKDEETKKQLLDKEHMLCHTVKVLITYG